MASSLPTLGGGTLHLAKRPATQAVRRRVAGGGCKSLTLTGFNRMARATILRAAKSCESCPKHPPSRTAPPIPDRMNRMQLSVAPARPRAEGGLLSRAANERWRPLSSGLCCRCLAVQCHVSVKCWQRSAPGLGWRLPVTSSLRGRGRNRYRGRFLPSCIHHGPHAQHTLAGRVS